MLVSRLRISRFRNLSFSDISLSAGVNCFLGLNGAGKTSVLEAFHVLARGRTFRASSLDVVVQSNQTQCALSLDGIESNSARRSIVFRKTRQGEISFELDGKRTNRLSQVANLLPVQLITPDCGDLLFDGPQLRRQFLDWGVFHVEHAYHDVLTRYSQALRQRNAWLKRLRVAPGPEDDPWLPVLGTLAEAIDSSRRKYAASFIPVFQRFLELLAGGLSVEIRYFRGWSSESGHHPFSDVLREGFERDVGSGFTRLGPHRADFRLTINGIAASQVVSRGQAKLVAIAMKLAQVQVLNDLCGERSTVLFDEMVAELDELKTGLVMELMHSQDCQVLLTAVELSRKLQTGLLARAKMFHVEQGMVREIPN